MAVPDQAHAIAGPLSAARARIEQRLAQAREVLAAHGVDPAASATVPRPRPAEYRVFRHPQLGVHCVVRDQTEVLGHACVFGPKHESGAPVTFAEALASANRGFLAWAQTYLHGDRAAMPDGATPAAVEREASQLARLYAERPGGREA